MKTELESEMLPFGMLDCNATETILKDITKAEYFNGYRWLSCSSSHCVHPALVYRMRNEFTKPSIDWSQISSLYKWLARDKNGKVFIYEDKPYIVPPDVAWSSTEISSVRDISFLTSVDPGDCSWEDSLICRYVDA